jgi:hypothetical protein
MFVYLTMLFRLHELHSTEWKCYCQQWLGQSTKGFGLKIFSDRHIILQFSYVS